LLLLVPLPGASAQVQQLAPPPVDDTYELDMENLPPFSFEGRSIPRTVDASMARSFSALAAETPPVGTVRNLIIFRPLTGQFFFQAHTLRAVGDHIEVWVANNLAFPGADPRNAVPGSTEVTDAQLASMVAEFDNTIYPIETTAFSTPPDHDGSNSLFEEVFGIPNDTTGAGEKTMMLVNNVQDGNFFDLANNPTYIAGFFFSFYNQVWDRNVITIDAFDWLHRTGTNPPNDPTNDPATSRPARPLLYEGVLAHEWQHLLLSYADPFESTFLNEGLSDIAQTLVGYVDTRLTIDDIGNDSHINSYLGWSTVQTPANPNPRNAGGPQNSLNLWDEFEAETNGAATLADYGHTYAFLTLLLDRYGVEIITRLHNDGGLQGLASIEAALADEGTNLYAALHDFQGATLLDRLVDKRFGIVIGESKGNVTTENLNSTVNLDNPMSYTAPGAAPNGADYVLLRKADGTPLKGKDLKSLKFQGATTLPSLPLLWSVVTDDPDSAGDAVLWSGDTPNTDSMAVTAVTVPAADPTLTFDAKYGAEIDFDYWFVYASTDGGATYTNITDTAVDNPRVSDSTIGFGPGISGTTDGFEAHEFDLSAYAGQNIHLALRYVTDPLVNEGGLLVDDVTVGGTLVSDGSSLAAFQSPSQVHPTPVENFNVQIWGINRDINTAVRVADINGRSSFSLGLLQTLTLKLFPEVVVIVAYDDSTEQVRQYAPYALTVNGVLQAGGS
jgi:hypothetical protein